MTMSTETENEELDEAEDKLLSDDAPDPYFMALGKAMDGVHCKVLKSPYADLVPEYKAVEAEFVTRAGGNEFFALETRRRVAEALLTEAHAKRQPFETYHAIWNDLLRLGFSHFERKSTMTWFYADCCRQTKESEAGLVVAFPLIIELDRLLAEP